MPSMDFLILTAQEKAEAEALNTEVFGVSADEMTSGPLAGGFIIPRRVVSDPLYIEHAPDLVAYLSTKPHAIMDLEEIFAPPE